MKSLLTALHMCGGHSGLGRWRESSEKELWEAESGREVASSVFQRRSRLLFSSFPIWGRARAQAAISSKASVGIDTTLQLCSYLGTCPGSKSPQLGKFGQIRWVSGAGAPAGVSYTPGIAAFPRDGERERQKWRCPVQRTFLGFFSQCTNLGATCHVIASWHFSYISSLAKTGNFSQIQVFICSLQGSQVSSDPYLHLNSEWPCEGETSKESKDKRSVVLLNPLLSLFCQWDLHNNDWPNQARIKTSKKQEENGNTWGPQRSREGSLEESKQHFFEASTAFDTLRHTKKSFLYSRWNSARRWVNIRQKKINFTRHPVWGSVHHSRPLLVW